MLNGDFYTSPRFGSSPTHNNKITKFLQSEFVRDLFPEHNSKATNPNFVFSPTKNISNCKAYLCNL